MKIDKGELSQKISKLKKAVPKKTPMTALQGILVSGGYLTATNMEVTVKAKINAVEEEPFIIPAKAFDLIGGLPDGLVEVIPDSRGRSFSVTIKADKIKNKQQTMNPQLFPEPDADETGGTFTIRAEKLLASMRRVSYAIPLVSTRQSICSLYMHAGGGSLNFVGADGHMIAWDRQDFDGDFKLLIPKETVDRILSIGFAGDVSICYGRNWATFATEEYEIRTRIVEGNYFEYTRMFSELPLRTAVVRSELLGCMVRAKMCTEEKAPARITIGGSEMSIEVRDATTEYHETVSVAGEIRDGFTIGFGKNLMIETLKAFDCENVAVSLQSSKMPIIIEAEDSDFKAAVLPVVLAA